MGTAKGAGSSRRGQKGKRLFTYISGLGMAAVVRMNTTQAGRAKTSLAGRDKGVKHAVRCVRNRGVCSGNWQTHRHADGSMRNMFQASTATCAERQKMARMSGKVFASATAASGSLEYSYEEKAYFADIIKRPILTENTTKAIEDNKFYFEVAKDCTKNEIKQAIETLFSVKVMSVNTITLPIKRKTNRMNGKQMIKRRNKRAIVTLKEGDTIPLFEEEDEDSFW